MVKIFLISMLLAASCRPVNAQISALRIGDDIPEIEMGKLLNDSTNRISIKDFKGKLLILDFWNIYCKVCISDMPKLDSLQNIFRDKLQIISITSNSGMQVNRLFSRITVPKPNFPFIVEDSVFNRLFPHQGDPLHVWISEVGKVIGITNDYNTNASNLKEYFSGKMPFLTRRWDYGINNDQPLISEANAGILSYASQYSVLFRSMEEITSTNMIRLTDTSIQVINGTLLQLYKVAYKDKLYDSSVNMFDMPVEDRVILNVKNKKPFLTPDTEEELGIWTLQNKYSYESKNESGTSKSSNEIMQEELVNYFPYVASVEKRSVQGFALRKLSSYLSSQIVAGKKGKSRLINEKPLGSLVWILNTIFSRDNIYFMDRTGLKGNFTIYVSSQMKNIGALNNDLKQYGLGLLPEQFDISFLVIRDK